MVKLLYTSPMDNPYTYVNAYGYSWPDAKRAAAKYRREKGVEKQWRDSMKVVRVDPRLEQHRRLWQSAAYRARAQSYVRRRRLLLEFIKLLEEDDD